MPFFETKSGIDQDLTRSTSLRTVDSLESLQGLSTPVRRSRNTCCSVSPALIDIPLSASKDLDGTEMEKGCEEQIWQFKSLADPQAPARPSEPSDHLPSKVPRLSFPEDNGNHASLSDLSLAAFVESLYTLEIAPSDGLTSNMLSSQLSDGFSHNGFNPNVPMDNEMLSAPSSGASDMKEGIEYAQSAFLHENLAFSVPSDMRWWDAAWNLPQSSDEPKSTSSQPKVPDMDQLTQEERFNSLINDTVLHTDTTFINSIKEANAQTTEDNNFLPDSSCGIAGKKPDSDTIATYRTSHAPSLHSRPAPERVHCVPSPSGTHCSCRCDSGLALLSLERTLRHQIQDTSTDTNSVSQNQAMSSLVFTLSMSQSISQKCGCSADCPTCKKDPSYHSSALLLISTALQIYARALQLFHDVLVADGPRGCGCSSSSGCCSCSGPSQSKSKQVTATKSSIDVRIGDYLPSGQNSRKIALYALKLELIDLERALARVHSAADRPLLPCSHKDRCNTSQHKSCCGTETSSSMESRKQPLCLNPIDRLVIRKLHVQLNEVLHALDDMGIHDNFK